MNKKSPAFYGVLASLALIASYVESLVPLPVPVPGIRLGLANAVVLAVLELFGFREAFLVSVVRILLSGFLFGNLFMCQNVFCKYTSNLFRRVHHGPTILKNHGNICTTQFSPFFRIVSQKILSF